MVRGGLWGLSSYTAVFWPFVVQDQLESVLEVLHRQMEQYRDQPQHLEKIAYQQKLLQEDLVHIRAELSRESTVRRGWQTCLPQDGLSKGLLFSPPKR